MKDTLKPEGSKPMLLSVSDGNIPRVREPVRGTSFQPPAVKPRKHRASTMEMTKFDFDFAGMPPEDMDPANTVLPLFVQMNVRLHDKDETWREASRWVKFQEDVEDNGKRWSKPFVPTHQLSTLLDLKKSLEDGLVTFDVRGTTADEIMDDLFAILQAEEDLERRALFEESQLEDLKMILGHRVRLQMKLNLRGLMELSGTKLVSQSSGSGLNVKITSPPRKASCEGFNFNESPPDSPRVDTPHQPHSDPPIHPRTYSASEEAKEKRDKKLRVHNLFMKKVPKGAEACNVFVASVPFVTKPITFFARLKKSVVLEDFCEISTPTRFLGIILGPPGSDQAILELGKSLGTLMSDQIFPLVCYGAKEVDHIISGIDNYTQQVTVLAPSAWDPKIRLEPPKNLPSIDERMRQHGGLPSISSSPYNTMKNGYRSVSSCFLDKPLLGDGDDPAEDNGIVIQMGNRGRRSSNGSECPSMVEGEELSRTGRLFGGLILDLKRKLPWFWSDFTDAFHIQTVASVIYIYLATITKAITFGGFLGDITDGQQGVLESFLAHALAGGMYCLLGGQPLTVLGCTGPVLIFEKILVDFCHSQEIDYMTFRLWIGLWSSLFCVVIVALDLSAIVRYFTRFTEESFAALIGIIFIVEALKKLYTMHLEYEVNAGFDPDWLTIYDKACHCIPSEDEFSPGLFQNATKTHPEAMESLGKLMNVTYDPQNLPFGKDDIPWDRLTMSQCQALKGTLTGDGCPYIPDIFFFSVILFFGTFAVAFSLKKFKVTSYFPNAVRSMLSDYAVIIAILIFVGVDITFNLQTPKLIVPTVFLPTRSDIRGWIIPFIHESDPWYMYLGAAIPALLLTILLFMDQQITSVIVNRSEHKLKKGAGYHLDMLVVGIMIGVCSILGIPWCVAATVLCLGHVDSLKMETATSAPGEMPRFLGVREQRVTGILVFLLTGLSVKLAPILKFIPMPVVYGILMYMGIASLRGMQFIDRIGLLFMPPKHQPDHIYLRHVPLGKVHMFTILQIVGLAMLWIVKSTPASLIFPLMVLALVGFRKLMDYFPQVISQHDLYWLDNLMPDREKKTRKKDSRTESIDATITQQPPTINLTEDPSKC